VAGRRHIGAVVSAAAVGSDSEISSASSERLPAFHSVLCAIDGSPESQEAAHQAMTIAAGVPLSFLAVPEYAGMTEAVARQVLAEAVEMARSEGLEATMELGERDGIPKAIQEYGGRHGLLAVGSHGQSRREGVVWGSTASLAAHTSPVPVLVARRPPDGEPFPSRILVASDGSGDSSRAVELAGRLAGRHAAETWIVHVGDWDDPQHSRAFSEQAVSLEQVTGSEPVVMELEGDAHRRIPELARKEGVSLTVVGSRGLTGVKALGSVSERIAHSSDGSVLIARPEPATR
jgi:nucleotide-binding universal stress UspA family protein